MTVTVRLAAFPTSSRAVTVMGFAPMTKGTEAFQAVVPRAVPLAAAAAFDQVTEATWTLSEAVPPSVSGEVVLLKFTAEVGTVTLMVGAWLSSMTVRVLVEMFPAASVAVMVIRFDPEVSAIGADQDVVPSVVPVAPVAAFDQVTVLSPTGSAAVPVTVTEGEAVA